jgi:hypothetical protein
MASRPTHILYSVQDAPEGGDGKAIWHEAGAAWPARVGYSIQIHHQFAVSGRLILMERKEREPAEPSSTPLRHRSARREPG